MNVVINCGSSSVRMATACPECGGRRCLFCRDEGCDRLTSGWERSDRPNVKTEQIQGGEQQKSTDEDRARALRLGHCQWRSSVWSSSGGSSSSRARCMGNRQPTSSCRVFARPSALRQQRRSTCQRRLAGMLQVHPQATGTDHIRLRLCRLSFDVDVLFRRLHIELV